MSTKLLCQVVVECVVDPKEVPEWADPTGGQPSGKTLGYHIGRRVDDLVGELKLDFPSIEQDTFQVVVKELSAKEIHKHLSEEAVILGWGDAHVVQKLC